MMEIINGLDWHSLIVVLWSILEYWLGKTDKVKAGSVWEMIINLIKSLITKKGV